MPAGRGGSLDDATYAGIVAYILHANGAAAGATAFTPATSVALNTIASGKLAADIAAPPAPAATAAANTVTSAGFARPGQAVKYGDPGRFTLPTKFGLALKGNIQNYVPVSDEMLTHPSRVGDWLMYRRKLCGMELQPALPDQHQERCLAATEVDVVHAGERHDGGTHPSCMTA